jgi:hypothetical protein
LPENIGNRRTFEEMKIPPDNVGNLEDRDVITTFVHDGLGNSVDEEPSHLQSGILSQFGGVRGKAHARKAREIATMRVKPMPEVRVAPIKHTQNHVVIDAKDLTGLSAEDYMAHLTNEFTRLLRLRLGAPFSFSMKPVTDNALDEEKARVSLEEIEKLIREIFSAASITASVSYLEYRTMNHRFAVFYVAPKEKDPVKNKDLISALRQIIKLHATKNSPEQTNVLLVLANAQHVIEEHLYKIGAKKI